MNLVTSIFANEINTSGYVAHENESLAMIRDQLTRLNATQIDTHVWQLGQRKIYLRLVDSVEDLLDLNHLTPRDLVITDNYIGRALNCPVIKLPDSWFGIYYHRPTVISPGELKDYTFLVNRLDGIRLEALLELSKKMHLHNGIININCVSPHNWNEHSHQVAIENFRQQWQLLGPVLQQHYQGEYRRLEPKMPFRNHDLTHDQAMQSARLNMVIETYSSDDVISFSEKIFRALVLPCAWTLLGGRFSVQRLRCLGFDVLDDVVDHDYDIARHTQDKVIRFVRSSQSSITSIDANRLLQAAKHNLDLLEKWNSTWQNDLVKWLEKINDHVKK